MYGGLRAKGEKPELALVSCDVDATVAGEVSVFSDE
jgi:glutamate N-acetyltransferase/amino-acid N-acetyltransferase